MLFLSLVKVIALLINNLPRLQYPSTQVSEKSMSANNSQFLNRKIQLSVSIVTFNHDKYIEKAIESILMQNVDFDYEIIIGEDFSSDKTRDIVIEYQKKYPQKIRLILPEKNLGCNGQKIFVQTLQACEGEYIALLDGDDYWTCPDKLQKQVDFLDNHPECAICFHDVTLFFEDGSQKPRRYNNFQPKEISTIENLLKSNFIPTCSTVYRKGLFDKFPDWYYSIICGDWILHLLNSQQGNIGYINKNMGAYRVHSQGVFSGISKTKQLQDVINCYELINDYFQLKYNNIIQIEQAYRYHDLALTYKKNGDLINAKKYENKCLQFLAADPFMGITAVIKLFKREFVSKVAGYKLQLNKT